MAGIIRDGFKKLAAMEHREYELPKPILPADSVTGRNTRNPEELDEKEVVTSPTEWLRSKAGEVSQEYLSAAESVIEGVVSVGAGDVKVVPLKNKISFKHGKYRFAVIEIRKGAYWIYVKDAGYRPDNIDLYTEPNGVIWVGIQLVSSTVEEALKLLKTYYEKNK